MKKIIALTTILALSFSLSACTSNNNGKAEIQIPLISDGEISYNTVKAEVGTISQSTYVSAWIGSPYVSDLGFKNVEGKISKVNFKYGDSVKKGDVIAELNSDDIDYEVSQQRLLVNSARETYDTLVKNKGDKFEIENARIDYEIAQSQLDTIASKLSNLTLVAPFDGTITWMSEVKAGDRVRNGDSIAQVTDTSFTAVMCSASGLEEMNVTYGTPVKVVQGKISESTATVIDTVKMGNEGESFYIVKLDDSSVELADLGGISIVFSTNTRDNTVIVPSDSVKNFQSRTFVNVLISGTKVEVDVQTGVIAGDKTEIISGLTGDEDVIVNTSA